MTKRKLETENRIDDINFNHLCMVPDEVDYVIYHHNCPDGFGSAFSAWLYLNKKFPDRKVEYYGASFGKYPPNVKDKNVLMCDFSYKKNILFQLMKDCHKLVILDHHKTAEDDLRDVPNQNKVFRMDHSGAYLTWRYFHYDEPIPKLIMYIQDNDIWTKKLDKINEVTSYISTVDQTFEEFNKLLDDKYIETDVIPLGTGMVRQNNYYINLNLKNVSPIFMEINNKFYFVAHINSTSLKSEMGHQILDAYPNCNFSAVYSISDTQNITNFSLRSMDDRTDVSEISAMFGGGGHRNASGIRVHSVVNTIPGIVHDKNKIYYLLQNIYINTITICNQLYKCVYLNSTNCEKQIGAYLLQTRINSEKINMQEVTYIMRNKHNSNNNYDCDMSAIWNYDGHNNKTWFFVTSTKDLFETLKVLLSSKKDYRVNDNNIIFTIDGYQSQIIN